MIAVRIGQNMRMAVVGAPSYFERRPPPRTPQDLTAHDCINLRTPTHGRLYLWEFDKDGHEFRVRVEGQLVFNNSALMLTAAIDGLGLAYLPEEQVRPHLADGQLVRYSRAGANRLPDITFIIRAGVSRQPPSLCWWTLFDTMTPAATRENRSLSCAVEDSRFIE